MTYAAIATIAAEPEIIAPADAVDVYLRPSPLRTDKTHYRVAAGLTIEEIVTDCATKSGLRPDKAALFVSLNGHGIERKNWSRIRVKPGVVVNVVRVPTGKAIGKVLGAIVAIVAAVVAPYLIPAALAGTAIGTVLTGVIGAGLPISGSMAVNALLPPEAADTGKPAK